MQQATNSHELVILYVLQPCPSRKKRDVEILDEDEFRDLVKRSSEDLITLDIKITNGNVSHNYSTTLADDSLEVLYFVFFRKLGMMTQNLFPATVMIGTLMV